MSDPLPLIMTIVPDGLGTAAIAAWAFAPENVSDLLPPLWLLCIPGGSYRGLAYYDRQVPGSAPAIYSMARTLASHGVGLVVIDNLGTGASRVESDGTRLTRAVFADAYAQLVTQLRERLAHGTLVAGLAPVDEDRLFLAGVGHSLGAALLIQTMADHPCLDAAVLLGWPVRPDTATPQTVAPCIVAVQQCWRSEREAGYGTLSPARDHLAPFFYGPDLPRALVEQDVADAVGVPAAWADFLRPGAFAEEAARLSYPLFVGFAGVDTLTPHAEVAAYPSTTSLTLVVQPDAPHCATFAHGRHALWQEIASFVRAQATGRWPLPDEAAATQPLAW